MRVPLIVASFAVVVATPALVAATGPSMSGAAFLTAARCAAYESVAGHNSDIGWVQAQLNAEALRQPGETVAAARAEIGAVARDAASTRTPQDAAAWHAAGRAACAGAVVASSEPVRQEG